MIATKNSTQRITGGLFQKTRRVLPLMALFAAGMSVASVQAQTTSQTKLPHIIVLATGGTIAGKASDRSAIGYNAGQVTGQQLVADVPGVDKLARIDAEQISNVGSQDMNDAIWFKLARRIDQLFKSGQADGIVVTHGTDTMEETAFFLQYALHSNKPVVLVGSMRPSTSVSADGPGNLYEAIEVAASPEAQGRRVMVVMDDTIQSPRWVTKTNTTSLQTFKSPNQGVMGYVYPGHVRFLTAPVLPSQVYSFPHKGDLPRVDIVYGHSNMGAAEINDSIRDHVRGIVLAGVGDGNSSVAAIRALHHAVEKGIVVVRSSRVGSGFVNRNVEVNDDQNGFVVAEDLNPQKARILTQLLIASGITSPKDVQKAFKVSR